MRDKAMTITIPLTKGKETVVDDCDANLAEFRWHTSVGYARRSGSSRGARVLIHRVILERMIGRTLQVGEFVDHVDGDPLNNRRSNLRMATKAQNNRNKKNLNRSLSGLKGAHYHRRKCKWTSAIKVNDQSIYLGSFDTPQEAHAAYCEAAKKYHGEFARFE
jgi:hypothetical protein